MRKPREMCIRDKGGSEALELGGLEFAVVRGRFLLPAFGYVATWGRAQAYGGNDSYDNDARAYDIKGSRYTGHINKLDDQRGQEGSRSAIEGHAEAGGEAALVRVPAGGALGGSGIGETHAQRCV